MTDDDRRKHRRFSLMKPAAIILGPTGEHTTGKLYDLSLTGASIVTTWAVTTGVGTYIRFVLATGIECEATGSVIRVYPFGKEFGVAIQFGYANGPFGAFLHRLEAAGEANRPDLLAEINDLSIQFA